MMSLFKELEDKFNKKFDNLIEEIRVVKKKQDEILAEVKKQNNK